MSILQLNIITSFGEKVKGIKQNRTCPIAEVIVWTMRYAGRGESTQKKDERLEQKYSG